MLFVMFPFASILHVHPVYIHRKASRSRSAAHIARVYDDARDCMNSFKSNPSSDPARKFHCPRMARTLDVCFMDTVEHRFDHLVAIE